MLCRAGKGSRPRKGHDLVEITIALPQELPTPGNTGSEPRAYREEPRLVSKQMREILFGQIHDEKRKTEYQSYRSRLRELVFLNQRPQDYMQQHGEYGQ